MRWRAELAIVTPVAGTTRDVVSQTIQIEGVPLHVIDTAGLRDSQDTVERIGIERAWSQIERADAVLFLHDLTRADAADYRAGDDAVATALQLRLPRAVRVIDVWNKLDAAPTDAAPQVGDHESILLSAKTGVGLDLLRRKLLDVAGWQSAPEGVYMARERHVQALRSVDTHLAQATVMLSRQAQALDLLAEELRLAQSALSDITGEFSSDDLLGVIFSSFCIGK
jgi:tRNA modification GTPase